MRQEKKKTKINKWMERRRNSLVSEEREREREEESDTQLNKQQLSRNDV